MWLRGASNSLLSVQLERPKEVLHTHNKNLTTLQDSMHSHPNELLITQV